MKPEERSIRAAIAAQASDWFVASEEAPLNASDSAAFVAWLKTSPVHIEEFLGVATIARSLKQARHDPDYSLQAILARAQVREDSVVLSLEARVPAKDSRKPAWVWITTGLIAGACALSLGLLWEWKARVPTPEAQFGDSAIDFATGHGEQSTHRLADNSVVHLNSDSAISIRYRNTERLVLLTAGEAEFNVAHEPTRVFRVISGSTQIIDRGTQFDVRRDRNTSVVTVIEGSVAVGGASLLKSGARSDDSHAPGWVFVAAGQQTRIPEQGEPAAPQAVDTQNAIAWLRREIVCDHETLERVAAEYNRYTPKPFEIATPGLKSLQISGVFPIDDTAAFIAFLRSLKGVRVEVTDKRVQVFAD